MEWECSGNSLLEVLLCLISNILPEKEQTETVILDILMLRLVNEEPDEDLVELCSLEYILDSFDADEKKVLEPEIKASKDKHSDWKTYRSAVGSWRVTFQHSLEVKKYTLLEFQFEYGFE